MNRSVKTMTPMLLSAMLLCGVLAETAAAQSLWTEDGPKANLIASNIARKKGDLLTIIIRESQKVEDKQEVKLEKESTLDSVLESFNIKENAFNPLPDMKQTTSKDFEGKSDYDKEGSFEASISVTVKDVLPNKNLVVEGRRHIYMDDEEKIIKISGVVRPIDVSSENTVTSDKVSEAMVSYEGDGPLTRNTKKNWFDKILDFIWPF